MRYCISFLLFVIVITSSLVSAQGANFAWAKRFGGNLNDITYSTCDRSTNVYRIEGTAITKHNIIY